MDKHQTSIGGSHRLAIANYELIEKIGEGGHGFVFKGKQLSTGQLVAIKTLKLQGIFDPQKRKQQLARFERETNLCAKINHHNIVRLIDKGYTEDEEPFAVFEFVSGITLKQYISQEQGLSGTATQNLMSQVLDALVCAHANGVIHRDLKPQNIMVTNVGARAHIKILDFGIGTFTQDFRSAEYQTLTLTQEFLGTPTYSAPEQLRGEPPTEKSDLYAWGLILIECLTTKPVIKGKSIAEVFQQQLMPTNVSIPPAVLGHPLGDLMRRVLDKNPQRRIASAEVILEELEQINFSTLIGTIQTKVGGQADLDDEDDEDDMTVANTMLFRSAAALRKQITVVGIKLNLILSRKSNLDLETLDAVEKDQLNLCKDIAIKYGGYVAGSISNHILIYFGYPEVHDTDARRAGRTALELITEAKKRSALLEEAHGIRIALRTSLHSGTVLILPNQIPEGNVPNTAFELLYQADAGSALASPSSKKLLEPFLDFEFAKEVELPNEPFPVSSYSLLGERQSEALSTLKSWSTQRDMIGREHEMAQLHHYWEHAQDSLQAVILNGQAGIGKSRLTYEVKKYVQGNGYQLKECRCLPEYQNNALSPFLEMLKRHWGIKGEEEDSKRLEEVVNHAAPEIEGAYPILCSWLSLPLPEGIEMSAKAPDEQKLILFETLKNCLIQIDEKQAFLLVIEDLHWIDPTSKEFIEYLLKEAEAARYFMLITTRPTDSIASLDNVPVIELEPLNQSAIELMIRSVLGQKAISKGAVEYIVNRTDGIPLFVEELTSMLLEQAYLKLKNEQYDLVEDIEDQAIPITLQALLNAKLDRLGFAKETAQLAATIGREFDYNLLVKASVKDEGMVQSDLNQLMQADLVFHQRRINEDRYLFRHALIGDAAYGGMTNSRQKEVHQTLAETLEAEFPVKASNEPFTVARHWAGAELFDKASDYGIKTIQKLVASSANQEALGVNDEVHKWVGQMEDGSTKYKQELVLNENMLPVFTLVQGWGSEKFEKVVKRNNELINFFKTKDKPLLEISESIAKSEWMLFSSYFSRSENHKVLELGEMILNRLTHDENYRLKTAVSVLLGQTHLNLNNFDLSIQVLDEVIQNSLKTKDLLIYQTYGFDPCVHACGVMALIQYMFGNPTKGIHYANIGINYAKEVNSAMPIATAYLFASLLQAALNDQIAADNLLQELFHNHQEKLKDTTSERIIFLVEDWVKGETERAAQILTEIIEAKLNNSSHWYEALLVDTYIKNGQYDQAQTWLLSCIERADDYAKPVLFRQLGVVLTKQAASLTDEAISYFEQSIELSKLHQTKWLELHAIYEYLIALSMEEEMQHSLFSRLQELLIAIQDGNGFYLYQEAVKLNTGES